MRWMVLSGLVLLGLISGAASAQVEEPILREIEVRADFPVGPAGPLEDLSSLLSFEVGKPLTEEGIRRTLATLRATGRVARAAVFTRPAAEGVVAVLVLRGVILMESVDFEGSIGLPEERLRAALDVAAGEAMVEDRLLRSFYRLRDLYQETGFLDAQVRLQVTYPGSPDRGVVVFQVDSGPRAQVTAVTFDWSGSPVQDPTEGDGREKVLETLEMVPGAGFDAAALRDDRGRLRRWLIQQGYRLAQVSSARQQRGEGEAPEPSVVGIVWPVVLGPRVEVEVSGAELKRLRKKNLLPFLSDQGYDPALVQRSEELLRSFYQSQGFYAVEVSAETVEEDDRLEIRLDLDRGRKYVLRSVRFEGNLQISDEELESLMATKPRSLFHLGAGDLVDAELADDLENIRSYYALQGFSQAEAGPPRIETSRDNLDVVVPVREGPQRLVESLVVEGIQNPELAAEMESLLQELPLVEGGPFHPRHLEDSLTRLRFEYRSRGYEAVQISEQVTWPQGQDTPEGALGAVVKLRVLEGPQTRVGRVLVRGNGETREPVIRRFVDLEPGEPVSRARLLEVERELSRLGIFSQVDVDLSPGELGRAERDVVVRFEEGRSRRLSYGVGYDTDDGARGLLGVADRNIGGRAWTAQLDARVSQRDQRYRLLVGQPYLGGLDVPVTYSLFRFDEDRDSFQQESFGARMEGYRELRRGRFGLVLDYRIIQLQQVEIPLNEIERQDREIEVSSLIPNIFLDRRDDPFDPTEGWSSALQLQYAFPILSTDAHFLKLFVQQTGYRNLGAPGVLAGSLRLGAIEPLGSGVETITGGELENPVPIGERFFAGGRTSHRGFERDRLGVRGETLLSPADGLVPVGGNALVLANLEYRFPVIGALGGTLFADVGNVWSDWQAIDLSEVRTAVGLGIRYRSPVGPVRLELGWNLDREPGESGAELFINLGNPF